MGELLIPIIYMWWKFSLLTPWVMEKTQEDSSFWIKESNDEKTNEEKVGTISFLKEKMEVT